MSKTISDIVSPSCTWKTRKAEEASYEKQSNAHRLQWQETHVSSYEYTVFHSKMEEDYKKFARPYWPSPFSSINDEQKIINSLASSSTSPTSTSQEVPRWLRRAPPPQRLLPCCSPSANNAAKHAIVAGICGIFGTCIDLFVGSSSKPRLWKTYLWRKVFKSNTDVFSRTGCKA